MCSSQTLPQLPRNIFGQAFSSQSGLARWKAATLAAQSTGTLLGFLAAYRIARPSVRLGTTRQECLQTAPETTVTTIIIPPFPSQRPWQTIKRLLAHGR